MNDAPTQQNSTPQEQTPTPPPTSETPSLINGGKPGETPAAEPPKEGAEPPKKEEAPAPTALTFDDLKEIEGLDAEDPHVKSFIDLQNDTSLSPKERAMKLLNLQKEVMTAVSEKGTTAFTELQNKWQQEVLADPEFAGEKLAPALAQIGGLIDKFGTEETRQAFDYTGAGNHPAIVRFLHKISAHFAEPKSPATGGREPSGEKSRAEKLYPNQGAS